MNDATWMGDGPTPIENFKKPKESAMWIMKQKLKPILINTPTIVKGPEIIPAPDPFLAYLEWKLNQPFFSRIFLP